MLTKNMNSKTSKTELNFHSNTREKYMQFIWFAKNWSLIGYCLEEKSTNVDRDQALKDSLISLFYAGAIFHRI